MRLPHTICHTPNFPRSFLSALLLSLQFLVYVLWIFAIFRIGSGIILALVAVSYLFTHSPYYFLFGMDIFLFSLGAIDFGLCAMYLLIYFICALYSLHCGMWCVFRIRCQMLCIWQRAKKTQKLSSWSRWNLDLCDFGWFIFWLYSR